MDQQRAAAVEDEPELLAAPPRGDDPTPGEEPRHARRVRALVEDLAVEEAVAGAAALLRALDARDRAPDDAPLQEQTLRLGLGQLRHPL